MPPIQQQQTSRGGLIAALVVTIVFAVAVLVAFIMGNADKSAAERRADVAEGKLKKVISEGALGNVGELQAQMSADPDKPRPGTLLDAATEQRKNLVRLITGSPEGSEKSAVDEVNTALAAIKNNPALKDASLPADNGLTKLVTNLSTKVSGDAAALEKARADLKKASDDLQAEIANHKAEIAKRDQAVSDAQASAAKTTADCKTAIDEKQKQVDDFSKQVEAANKQLTDSQAQFQVQLQTAQRESSDWKQKYEAVNVRLAQFKPNVKESLIRNVDAVITQVAPDSICYINLGYGDHVSPGLTFEVYDKFEGIPKMNDGTSALDMPKGKASIEIINVGQNSSQCRITTNRPGITVAQGDLCVNIVYDRNIKPTFYVYGKFDMDQNGVATEGEAEILKNLITRWGGRIVDHIGVDTDFVVMGKEPSVPLYSPEELQQPIQKAKFDEAQAALKAYNDARDQAVSLHIPVMNQNRFLYYTGYFEASKK
jgi:hypothetical protein